jgi:WD40 repeat protein
VRKITITLCLSILALFCFANVNDSLGKEEGSEQWRRNGLKELYFIPRQELLVATCSSEPNESIRFWSIDNGNLKEVLDLGMNDWATSLAVSNGGDVIAVAFLSRGETGCYSLKEKRWLWKVSRVSKAVFGNSMRFTPDDKKLVVVGVTNIVIYDAHTGAVLQKQEDSKRFSDGFPNYIARLGAISPSGRYAGFWHGYPLVHGETWASSRNIWVLVRDIEREKTIAKQGKIQEKYKNCSATFTPEEKNLLLGSMDGYVRVWSIADQKVIREWRAYGTGEVQVAFKEMPWPYRIESMTVSPDGRYLATMGPHTSKGFTVRIWDYSSNKMIHEFVDVGPNLTMCSGYAMAFSPDGKYFALEQRGNLCLYDTQTWQRKWSVPSWAEDKQ